MTMEVGDYLIMEAEIVFKSTEMAIGYIIRIRVRILVFGAIICSQSSDPMRDL